MAKITRKKLVDDLNAAKAALATANAAVPPTPPATLATLTADRDRAQRALSTWDTSAAAAARAAVVPPPPATSRVREHRNHGLAFWMAVALALLGVLAIALWMWRGFNCNTCNAAAPATTQTEVAFTRHPHGQGATPKVTTAPKPPTPPRQQHTPPPAQPPTVQQQAFDGPSDHEEIVRVTTCQQLVADRSAAALACKAKDAPDFSTAGTAPDNKGCGWLRRGC